MLPPAERSSRPRRAPRPGDGARRPGDPETRTRTRTPHPGPGAYLHIAEEQEEEVQEEEEQEEEVRVSDPGLAASFWGFRATTLFSCGRRFLPSCPPGAGDCG
ncbi:unnamed protein product [Merluccius merluccius]